MKVSVLDGMRVSCSLKRKERYSYPHHTERTAFMDKEPSNATSLNPPSFSPHAPLFRRLHLSIHAKPTPMIKPFCKSDRSLQIKLFFIPPCPTRLPYCPQRLDIMRVERTLSR